MFVDFWNLIENLRRSLGDRSTEFDWDELPVALLEVGSKILSTRQVGVSLDLHGVYVYGAPRSSGPFTTNWFRNNLKTKPGFLVTVLDRKPDPHKCRKCRTRNVVNREKGADASLISDLMWLAWQDRYDVAFLISADSDMIPTIERVQISGRRVIAVTPEANRELTSACFARIAIEDMFMGSFHRFFPGLDEGPGYSRMEDHRSRLLRGEKRYDIEVEWARNDPTSIDGMISWHLSQLLGEPDRQAELAAELGFERVQGNRFIRIAETEGPSVDDLVRLQRQTGRRPE